MKHQGSASFVRAFEGTVASASGSAETIFMAALSLAELSSIRARSVEMGLESPPNGIAEAPYGEL
jgi:hypothetical protein